MFAEESWRNGLAAACTSHELGPASLVLYDVSALYFEADTGDGFREPGFSKERRLEPQITIGMLTNASGYPLMVNAFEGNKAENVDDTSNLLRCLPLYSCDLVSHHEVEP